MTPPRIQEAWLLMRRHLQAPPGREVGAPDASGFLGFSATAEHTCASQSHQASRRNEYIERTGRHMGEYYLAMKRSGARSLSTPWTWLDPTGTEGQGRAWPSGQRSGAGESRGRRQIRGRRGWRGRESLSPGRAGGFSSRCGPWLFCDGILRHRIHAWKSGESGNIYLYLRM